MGTFLKLLQLELDSLEQSDYFEPEAELGSDDNVVGELSDDLVRLFTMWRQAQKSMTEKAIQARFGRLDDDKRDELLAQTEEAHLKMHVVSDLFWIEVREEHKLWDKSNIGVRKGRKVVWYEDKGPTILGFGFSGLGGGLDRDP